MIKSINAIYDEIKAKIIELDLAPGTKIKEEDLAAQYGVSRTPIRGIIARLVQDGLLVVMPQKGTFVSQIDVNYINDFIFVRKAVEMKVLRKAIELATEEDLQLLKDILDEQAQIVEEEPSIQKSKSFYVNDNKFHACIFSIAGMAGVWKLVYDGAVPLNRARIMANLRDSSRVKEVYKQHYAVYELIKSRDQEGAAKAYESHLDSGFDGLTPVMETYKEYFVGGKE